MRLRVQGWIVAVALGGSMSCPAALGQTGESPVPAEAAQDVPRVELEDPSDAGSPDAVPDPPDDQAADESEDAAAEEPTPPGQWAPPLPSATAFDWLQMKSGEWLKGELKTLRDYRVIFDSDEFDELDLDWEKVTSFYLPRPHSFRVQGRVLLGTAELRADVLRIRTVDEVFEFTRRELSSIAQGGGSERDWWSLRVGASLAARQGNTDQVDLQGSATIRRETAIARFVTDYRGTFSKIDGDETTNNHRVNTNLDYFLTRRLYWTIPFVEYYADKIQNIDARVTPGSALGYEFFRNATVEFDASLGGAYQYTRLSADADERRTSHDFAIVHTAELNFDFPGGTDFDNSYRLQLVPTDFGKTSHHSESVLSFDVWGPLDLDVTFIWDRIQSPAENDVKTGEPKESLKKDDFRLLVGLALEF